MFGKPAVIAALGNREYNSILREMSEISFIYEVSTNFDLKNKAELRDADTIIASDLMENVENTLLLIKRNNPKLRIIYFCAPLKKGEYKKLAKLEEFYKVGIYDILFTTEYTKDAFLRAIKNPKGPAAMAFLADEELSTKEALAYSDAYKIFPGEIESLNVFMSLKPGSGKSYLAVNTACSIARFGVDSPRVALIEADLETPSVGTALGIDRDDGKNIKSVFDMIAPLFSGSNLTATEKDQNAVRAHIKEYFIQYKEQPNLHVLQGTSLMPEELAEFKAVPSYYMFLINAIKDDFDCIIVDLNSSLLGTVTYPFLQIAKNIICAVTMDANSIRQTLKYKSFLAKEDLDSKITWVMTKAMDNSRDFNGLGVNVEKLVFTPKDFDEIYFRINHKIPAIPESVFINHLYNGEPLVFDSKAYTKKTRDAIINLAEKLYELEKPEEKKKGLFGR